MVNRIYFGISHDDTTKNMQIIRKDKSQTMYVSNFTVGIYNS